MLKIDKRQVKIVSLAVVVFFLLGIVGIAASQSSKTYAAPSSNIGIVNYNAIIQQHPDTAKAEETLKAEYENLKKEYETRSASMSDQEKQDYQSQLQQRMSQKQQELLKEITDKVDATVKGIAEAKGLTVVIDKNYVVYGGQDITDEVLKKITGK
ncbi:MAG: outer rane chaperone Skp (OmpH) [Firmicutes bacterium]|nr:outer rane chaperone Skp (OmpH) [Bacillota bacterium]